MASLVDILSAHLTKYSHMEIQDLVKLLYQNEFGGGHLITDQQASLEYLKAECMALPNQSLSFENIGNHLVRVYLGNVDIKVVATINDLFILSARQITGSLDSFKEKMDLLKLLPIDQVSLSTYLQEYKQRGYPMVSHSDYYHQNYQPHYRIIKEEYIPFIDLISKLREKSSFTIAIDGRCGSGKSTLAMVLSHCFKAPIFHLDDFFLPPEKRTPERFTIPGNNVDHERFLTTVLVPLSKKQTVTYQRFDCQKMALEEAFTVPYHPINIIEGSYALRDNFVAYYSDYLVLDIDYQTQIKRIEKRNPLRLDQFIKRWIPLENQYFTYFHIYERYPVITTSNSLF